MIRFTSIVHIVFFTQLLNAQSMQPAKPIDCNLKTIQKEVHYIGKDFYGDYGKTAQYADELKELLIAANIEFEEFAAVSIYYSEPGKESENEMKSFHGFVIPQKLQHTDFIVGSLNPGQYIVSSTRDNTNVPRLAATAMQYALAHTLIDDIAQIPVLFTSADDKGILFEMFFLLTSD